MSNLIEALEIMIAALLLSFASSVLGRSELQFLSKGWCMKLILAPDIRRGVRNRHFVERCLLALRARRFQERREWFS